MDAKIVLQAVDQTKAAVEAAKRNLAGLSDTAGIVTARLGTLGVALTGAFTAVTLKGAIDTLDMLDDLSEKTGIATETLSSLRYAGEVTGTSIEAIAAGTRKLSMNMAEAASGNKEAIRTFETLGVKVKNADGTLRSQDQVLGDLADKFASFQDGAAKAALAQQIFGKSGADMIPLLNQGSAGIRALTDEAKALGGVFGGELAKQAATFNDNLKRLELNAEAAKVSLLSGLLPALNKVTEGFLAMKREGLLGTIAKDAAKDVFGFGRMTSDPGADLEGFRRERQRIQNSRAFAERRGLPVDGFDRELDELSKLMQASRIRQQMGALDGLGDTSDAVSRRLGFGKRVDAPVVPGGDGKDKAAKAAEQEAKERARIMADLVGLESDYTEQLRRRQAMRAAGQITEQQYIDSVIQLIEKQPMAKRLIEEQAKAEKELASTREKVSELQQKYLADLATENEAAAKRNQDLAAEIEEMGLSKDALDLLRQSRLQSNIERERESLLVAQNIENNEAEVALIERRIALMERQLGLEREGSVKRRDVEAKEKADAASKDFSQSLHSDLKGALQRAFEDSENPAKAFAKALASVVYSRLTASLAESVADGLLGPLEQLLRGAGAGGGKGGSGVGGLVGGLLRGIGGDFGFGGVTPPNPFFGSSAPFLGGDIGFVPVAHTGGLIGRDLLGSRAVPGGMFQGAPRYHTGGLAGDEVPAILKRGEGVFTPGQMKALGEQRQEAGDMKVTILNQTSAPIGRVTEQRLSAGERVLIIEEAVERVAAELGTSNSRMSRNLTGNFDVRRRRS